eukprot:39249-Eustigmatos_ZCMA.PRE.1
MPWRTLLPTTWLNSLRTAALSPARTLATEPHQLVLHSITSAFKGNTVTASYVGCFSPLRGPPVTTGVSL